MTSLTITAAAASARLITAARLKSELGIRDASRDGELDAVIDAVSRGFATACGREPVNGFGRVTAAETFRFGAALSSPLWLRQWPVTAIVSVVENGVTLTGADYTLENGRKLRRLDGADNVIAWPQGKITVTYEGGYALPEGCPADLALAAAAAATQAWYGRGRDGAIRSESIPGVIEQSYWSQGVAEGGDSRAQIQSVLGNYRNWS